MKRHPRTLAEAGISPARYAELRDICRQYREMRRAVSMAEHYGTHRMLTPRAGRDPTGDAAVTLATLPEGRRARIIEQTATDVGGRAIGRAILMSVTDGMDYEKARPPCGKRQFYQMRLIFFLELDRRLWESEMGG